MTARHFLDLADAISIDTPHVALTRRTVSDITKHRALGVVHGAAGLGKTFAVEQAVADLDPGWSAVWISFPARPTMRLVAQELLDAITGTHERSDRFRLTRALKNELSLAKRLIVVDEAQNLNTECIEFLRYLAEDPCRGGGILLVGGDGCWNVLSREPMLRSRVFRRVLFTPLTESEVVRTIGAYHPIYEGVDERVIRFIDMYCGHGNFRNWASLTLTAVDLCADEGRPRIDEQIARNAFALLGGGVDAS